MKGKRIPADYLKQLQDLPHFIGMTWSVEWVMPVENDEGTIPEITDVLTVECDMEMDSSTPGYSQESMRMFSGLIHKIQFDRDINHDRHIGKVILKGQQIKKGQIIGPIL